MNKKENVLVINNLIVLIAFGQIFGLFYLKDYSFANALVFLLLISFSLIYLKKEELRLKEYLTTYIIGIIFFFCLFRIFVSNDFFLTQIYMYLISLCIYHYMEYTFVCVFHFESLNFNSFLINQSKEYMIATSVSIIEYFVEIFIFGSFKINIYLIVIGFLMLSIGHVFRISALFTAGQNFTHLIAFRKKKQHHLVKTGIYSISRHPSYFGFFIWSIGCQILCFNPICMFGFTYVLWIFFNERIQDEEPLLISFFGEEYLNYKNEVPILIPGISISKDEEEKALYFYHRNLSQNVMNE